MANTYSQIYLQLVFAVQDRNSLIQSEWNNDLYKYITGIIQNNKHKLIAINGTSNHMHIFIGYQPHQLIPELMQDIKGSSSKWINAKRLSGGKFTWQEGYGAFSYSHSQIDRVVKYIYNQEQHHKRQSFHDEYMQLLKKFNISFDTKYVLHEIV
jgi:REP element-mobilizing transposase RayT